MSVRDIMAVQGGGPTQPAYLTEVDVAKGLAIIGVLIAHAGAEADFGSFLDGLRLALGWCVAVFFTFAGFLEGKPGKVSSFAGYLRSRGLRLLVPWVILHCFYNFTLFGLSRAGVVQADTIRHASWWQVAASEWSPQLYFLPWLFFAGCLLWYPLRLAPLVTTVTLAALVAVSGFWWAGRNYGYGPHVENIPIYATAYAVGFAWRRGVFLGWPALVLGAAAICEIMRHGTYQAIHPLVGCGLIVAARACRHGLGGLGALGRWSFAIYLWHVPIVMPACHLLGQRLGLTGGANLTFMLSSTIAICMMLGRILAKTPLSLLVK